jgi:predicted metal-dependent phosphotriesterase family hydrolase
MTFIRTILGDIDATDLGVTYAHEHLIIDGGRTVELYPDFLLADVDKAVQELQAAVALGLRAVVDAMPCDAGRNVLKLAAISRQAGVHVVAPTGLHLAKYYDDRHWSLAASEDELAGLFAADIAEGIDERDYGGPLVRRTRHRAGVIKIAGSLNGLTTLERKVFAAAAAAHAMTGCPILTHCQEGTAALDQIEALRQDGVAPNKVVLSHTDKIVDRGYHREISATGAYLEYDQAFRWKPGPENGTLTLLEWMAEDGLLGQILLGMDAARQGYWSTYGGSPGMTYLLGAFAITMAEHGIGPSEQRALFIDNPARAYAFVKPVAPEGRDDHARTDAS